MPRDPSGNYSLPPSYLAQPGQTIRTEQHNPPLEDLAQAMTGSLPRDGRAGMVGDLNMGTFKITNVAPGVAATDVATIGQAGVPIGTIVDYAGSTAPAGWFFCAGQPLSRTTYATLFGIIGTTYGPGDSATTFNLPDFRGRVLAGKDDMGGTNANRLGSLWGSLARVLGANFGTAGHTLIEPEMPRHQHSGGTTADGSHDHGVGIPAGNAGGGSLRMVPSNGTAIFGTRTDAAGTHTHTFVTDFRGSSQPHTNTQPTSIVNKIIKATL